MQIFLNFLKFILLVELVRIPNPSCKHTFLSKPFEYIRANEFHPSSFYVRASLHDSEFKIQA